MHPHTVTKFALKPHEGEYETWPGESQLIVDGETIKTWIPGYRLLRQYETPLGFILITDYDCPHEESIAVSLVCHRYYILIEECDITRPYNSFILKDVEWLEDNQFVVSVEDMAIEWKFTIRSWGIPYLYPRLVKERL